MDSKFCPLGHAKHLNHFRGEFNRSFHEFDSYVQINLSYSHSTFSLFIPSFLVDSLLPYSYINLSIFPLRNKVFHFLVRSLILLRSVLILMLHKDLLTPPHCREQLVFCVSHIYLLTWEYFKIQYFFLIVCLPRSKRLKSPNSQIFSHSWISLSCLIIFPLQISNSFCYK